MANPIGSWFEGFGSRKNGIPREPRAFSPRLESHAAVPAPSVETPTWMWIFRHVVDIGKLFLAFCLAAIAMDAAGYLG